MIEIIVSRRDALALGLPRYFLGKPCRHGHFGERYTRSGICVPCASKRNKERPAGDGAAYARQWRAANREHYRAYIRTYMRSYTLSPAQRERKRLYQIERRRKLRAAR